MFGTIHFLPPNVDPNKVLPFILDGQETLAVGAGASQVIASSALLSSYVGVILAFGVTVRDSTYEYTGNIKFSLNFNQNPFISNGQGSWTTERGSVANPMPTYIRIPLGCQKVTFVATRDSVVPLAQTIAVLATGVMWPSNPNPSETDAARFRV